MAKKSLGQHFLTSERIAHTIAECAGDKELDTILEIGPGKGALTKHLLATGTHVRALETDPDMVAILEKVFADEIENGQLELILGDFRDTEDSFWCTMGKYSVAANIPYYITGLIIRTLLEAPCQPEHMTLLVQKEVAERIAARDGKESMLSIAVKAYGTARKVENVSRRYFVPPPKVDSAIITIRDISRVRFESSGISESEFFNIVRTCFAHKRKTLSNNLKTAHEAGRIENVLSTLSIAPTIRAEDLSIDTFFALAKLLEDGR